MITAVSIQAIVQLSGGPQQPSWGGGGMHLNPLPSSPPPQGPGYYYAGIYSMESSVPCIALVHVIVLLAITKNTEWWETLVRCLIW